MIETAHPLRPVCLFVASLWAAAMFTGCSASPPPRRPSVPVVAASVATQDFAGRPAATPPASIAPEPSPVSAIPEESPPPPERPSSLELTFVGDVIFGRYGDRGFDAIAGDDYPLFGDVLRLMASDALIGNLETPLVTTLPAVSPVRMRNRFGASRVHARQLQSAGFFAMSLANNHWFDQALPGVEQTPAILRDLGIVPLGSAVRRPPVYRIESAVRNGWSLGFVSITTRINAPLVARRALLPFLEPDEIGTRIAPVVRAARSQHDLVIVLVHWGTEYADAPDPAQIEAAHRLVEAGADLVIGHHPHVLQAVERYRGGLIAYSLGNFLFDHVSDAQGQSAVLRVRVRAHCIDRTVLHPVQIETEPVTHPVPAAGVTAQRIRDRVTALGGPFGTRWNATGEALLLDAPGCPQ